MIPPSLQPRWLTLATASTSAEDVWPHDNDTALVHSTFHYRVVLPEQVLMPITLTNEDGDDDRQQLPNLLPTWQGIIVRDTQQPRPALRAHHYNRQAVQEEEEDSLASSGNTMHLVTPTRQETLPMHEVPSFASSSRCCLPSSFVRTNIQVVEHLTVPDVLQYPHLLAPQE